MKETKIFATFLDGRWRWSIMNLTLFKLMSDPFNMGLRMNYTIYDRSIVDLYLIIMDFKMSNEQLIARFR